MSIEHLFNDKAKVKPKQAPQTSGVQRAPDPLTLKKIQRKLDVTTVTQMQQTIGNAAVQRYLVQRDGGAGAFELDDNVTAEIQSERGGGQKIDSGLAQQTGDVIGQDLTNTNIHTGAKADQLNRQVNSEAFTIGNDIFFREGKYQPNTSSGQKLISHELTHVGQQGGGTPTVQAKLSVNDPNDSFEGEAENVSNIVMSQSADTATAQRQEEEDVMTKRADVQRQEEEEVMPMRLQRQEEEEVMPMRLQRQEEEEVMPMRMDIQRQEEEEVMPMRADIQRQEEDEMM